MAVNQYLAWAVGAGANTISPTSYAAHPLVAQGHVPGVALSEVINTNLRQASVGVAGVAEFAKIKADVDMLDDGSVANFAAKLALAVQAMIETNQGWKTGDVKMTSDPTLANHPGWIKANGAVVSRTGVTAGLFALYGTSFGAGDGSTTFQLPDWRGEFPRFWDDGRGVDNTRAIRSFQADEFKSHTHTMGSEGGGGQNLATPVDSSGVDETTAGNPTGATGGAETRPRNIAFMVLIKL